MLELFVLKYAKSKDNNPGATLTWRKAPGKKRQLAISYTIVMVLYILFWFWALLRAFKCSSATPDSRAVHFLFATVSPLLYIILSYWVDGFCKKK